MSDVIPDPGLVTTSGPGFFDMTPTTGLVAGDGTERTERWLRAVLGAATGLPLPARDAGDGGAPVGKKLHQSLGGENLERLA